MNTVPWLIYILQCSDNSYYVGITPNISQRVLLHNAGKAARHTRENRPVVLVYSKQYPSKSEARKREIQLKGWSRVKKEKLINGELL